MTTLNDVVSRSMYANFFDNEHQDRLFATAVPHDPRDLKAVDHGS